MKRSARFCWSLVLVLAFGFPLYTQAQDSTPAPNILQIYREEVKPGHGPAHAKTEAGWPRAFAKAKSTTYYTAMTSLTGPTEAWFITGFESLEAWEKNTQAERENAALQTELDRLSTEDGGHLNMGRSIVARYRPELSHRPGVNIAKMRYLSITIVRVRPGRNEDFTAARAILKAAHEKAGVKDNHSVFQVMSGMPNGTFLVITPMKSLAEVDAFPQIHNEAYRNAIGDDGRKKLSELATSGTLNSETIYFAFTPGMSYVSPEWIAADPGFWKPKPMKAAPAKPAASGN